MKWKLKLIKGKIVHLHWMLKQAGLYYALFHIRWFRNKFKRMEWHHWLGCNYGRDNGKW